ncbi:hypothetical protein NC653_010749 [Populus alba x Populus x berolinensis]|uniref:Receptor-like serine/threonine-protein kinase n=1 Tax=Populus alba x Populus x berolinensis TaxID=444605 RepID=A0AAD6R0V6_9ROSI|nr:hypothetical protein NC653_010749 [Populus alba x Populus x berolinensis]
MAVLQLLIILWSLPYLLEAQIHYADTAQVSTSWTNNNISLPSISSASRIILSNEIGFACGFYTDYYGVFLAVGIAKTWTDWSVGNGSRYFSHLIWSANRNKPVSENATLQFLPEGNLVLRDADGTLVWSTNTSNKSVVGMKMMETGNLVLYNRNNKTIWQSFDHATDALLLGQILQVGQKLVASVSRGNRSEGSYYLSVTSQGLFAFYQANIPQMYYYNRPFDGTLIKGFQLNYSASDNGTLCQFIRSDSAGDHEVWFGRSNRCSQTSYMKYDHDGHLRLYDDNLDQPVDLLEDEMNDCDYPTSCGTYGLCSGGRCSCPSGFAPDNDSMAQGKYGCLEINPVECENPHQSQSLLTLEGVHYFNYIDHDAAALKETDMKSCQEACLNNCSCKAALFLQKDAFLQGSCFLPSPVLSLSRDWISLTPQAYKSYAFIKVSNHGKIGRVSRPQIIAGSTIGTIVIVGLVVGLWIVLSRKKNNGVEGTEDFLDQLQGMPTRFTYEELKAATKDFHTKLGKGGFGSVFEGNLETGEKIAVKRLEGLGQGKKEFLAEVKTIGSIHHVNLVRLIGFCVDKLNCLLVYEFLCNGSLDSWIFLKEPRQPSLDWEGRRTIILDIARGLAYLHEECRQRIIHLDIKPQNILLDARLRAKISDFGLSKLIDRDQSQVVTTMRGTPGYLAPELFSSVITEKADVYSFGIVVMEVVCGKKNLDRSQPAECMHLLPILMKRAQEDQLIDMVDNSSEDMQLHRLEAAEMMRVAIWCLQSDHTRRPSMSTVVKVLEGTMGVEADLDYCLQNATTMAAIRREAELGGTATLLPSLLSGPR